MKLRSDRKRCKILEIQKNLECCSDNLVELENCCKMSLQSQKSASIQPSTGLGKVQAAELRRRRPRWWYALPGARSARAARPSRSSAHRRATSRPGRPSSRSAPRCSPHARTPRPLVEKITNQSVNLVKVVISLHFLHCLFRQQVYSRE